MKTDSKGVLEGVHFLDGDFACGEGAMAAGCRFVAGYPITPSTEVVERISRRFPMMGGTFIQMEDELASMAAVVGASWTGTKSMTPSTGLPTMVGQADMMQARWGSHGDYELIAMCPQSPQESFDLMIDAFNLSEEYRLPVLFMMDECVGHMTEKVVIPPAEEIEIRPRVLTKTPPGEFLPYRVNGTSIPEFARAGDGYRFHSTGLTHDERGYPVMSEEVQEQCVRRLVDKIRNNAERIVRFEEDGVDDAEVVVVAYGITARVAREAVDLARAKGVKAGMMRLVIVWPFPEKRIQALAKKIKAFVVPEVNYGQIVFEVERCAYAQAKAIPCPHGGGGVHDPEKICKTILEAAK